MNPSDQGSINQPQQLTQPQNAVPLPQAKPQQPQQQIPIVPPLETSGQQTPPLSIQFNSNPYATNQPQQLGQISSSANYIPAPGQAVPGSYEAAQASTPVGPDPVLGKKDKNTEQPKVNPNSTQNTLQIAEIRDGVVIMNDGSFRSVVMLKSINFDLMSPGEREGIEYAYQGFLNSLYFPVQIFVRSQKVDIRPYLEKLDKIRSEHENMLLAVLMDDYLDFIDQLAAQTNIMDKKFYITIPYFPGKDEAMVKQKKSTASNKSLIDGVFKMFSNTKTHVVIDEQKLEDAKAELRNRVQAVLNGLLQCGVQGLPLDTEELIELYYDFYNPDTATRQQLKNFDDLTAPVVTKGEGQAPQPQLERYLQ